MALSVFLDFEASSLGRHGFPVELAWVFETGEAESFLIRPAEGWTEWAAEAEAVHRIPRGTLEREGRPAGEVASRAIEVLSGHRLYASAPSWDGQWLSKLLRAGGKPRHALRLRDTEEAQREVALAVLADAPDREALVQRVLEEARAAAPKTPVHRALPDAEAELALWRDVRRRAEDALAATG
jgi:hypothetical protein